MWRTPPVPPSPELTTDQQLELDLCGQMPFRMPQCGRDLCVQSGRDWSPPLCMVAHWRRWRHAWISVLDYSWVVILFQPVRTFMLLICYLIYLLIRRNWRDRNLKVEICLAKILLSNSVKLDIFRSSNLKVIKEISRLSDQPSYFIKPEGLVSIAAAQNDVCCRWRPSVRPRKISSKTGKAVERNLILDESPWPEDGFRAKKFQNIFTTNFWRFFVHFW